MNEAHFKNNVKIAWLYVKLMQHYVQDPETHAFTERAKSLDKKAVGGLLGEQTLLGPASVRAGKDLLDNHVQYDHPRCYNQLKLAAEHMFGHLGLAENLEAFVKEHCPKAHYGYELFVNDNKLYAENKHPQSPTFSSADVSLGAAETSSRAMGRSHKGDGPSRAR